MKLALVDAEFARSQLVLLTREWYMHPNGRLPTYEWALGDVNPPVCIINNDGYGTQRHIIDGKFNNIHPRHNIHPWKYTQICDLPGCGEAARVTTKGGLEAVLKKAFADDRAMYLIAAIVPRDDCSRSMLRFATQMAKERDVNKRG